MSDPELFSEFAELYGCDKGTTMRFFREGLLDSMEQAALSKTGSKPACHPTSQEIRYVSSVLFDFAVTPIGTSDGMLKPKDISVVRMILLQDLMGHQDAELIELAAAQTLFWNGFYREYIRKVYSVYEYDHLGQLFFEKAGQYHNDPGHRFIMERMSCNFKYWAQRCRDMQKTMH